METIIRIDDEGFQLKDKRRYNNTYDGFNIVTTEQTIRVGIDNSPGCCERWGIVTSEDSYDDFIGAKLLSVEVVDAALDRLQVPEMYEGSCMFVNINTDKGLFQLVVYNEHNGYYSHEAVVISREFNYEEHL